MTRDLRIQTSYALLLGALLTASVFLLQQVDKVRSDEPLQEVLYIPSPTVVKRLSLGYSGLLADIYWTRVVQYFGTKHKAKAKQYLILEPLLDMTATLDPQLLPSYQFGATFLAPAPPNGAGRPDEALKLLKFGIQNNPDNWSLYYNLGFLYYTEFKDYGKAAEAFAAGAKLPVTHQFMPVLAARMAQHAGEFDTARMLWYTAYETSKEADIRQNAVQHLVALRVDEDVTRLEEVVEKYRQQEGRLPTTISDLERAGFIRGTPADPNGKPYKLMADGRIEVQDPSLTLYITKGLPPGMSKP